MKDLDINAAIAKICGWTEINVRHRSGRVPNANYIGHEFLPDYCTDLNVMHEAEKMLNPAQIEDYVILVMGFSHEPIFATARQRAEALLRMLGKWEGGK